MNCPNCDKNRTFYDQHGTYKRCFFCGVYYLTGCSNKDLNEYYSSGVYRTKHKQVDERSHQQRRAAHIINYIDNPHVFVDIGSSMGVLLDAVRERYGSRCYGVDLDPLLAKDVYKTLADVPEQADCVTLIHSLEHMPHPLQMLKDVYAKLNSGGRVVIEVPNGEVRTDGRYYAGAFAFPHVVMFDAKALAWTLREAGFDNIKTIVHGNGGLAGAPEYYYLLAIGRK